MSDPYRNAARWYDRMVEPFVRRFREAGMRMAPPRPGMRVLDIGCGTGTWLERYAAHGAEVTGVDRSPAMLERAAARLGKAARLVEGDAGALPFGDASFDLVSATTLLHELPGDRRRPVLSEMRRVAAGRVLVIDYHPGRPAGAAGWLARAVETSFEWVAGGEHRRNARDFLDRGGVPDLAPRAGLTVEHSSLEAGGTVGVYLLV